MKPITIDGKTKQIATSLDELSVKQFIAFIRLAYMRYGELYVRHKGGYKLKNLPLYYAVRVSLLYVLLQVKPSLFSRFTPEQVRDLLEEHRVTDFFFHGTRTVRPFKYLRSFRIGFRIFIRRFRFRTKLYAPDEGFEHMHAEEWCFADTIYLRYKSTKNEGDLNTFLALLLRPRRRGYNPRSANTTGDIREPFNRNTEHFRIPAIARIPIYKRLAVLLWYEGYRATLRKVYPHVFSEAVEGKASEGGDMLSILLSMSGKKFGTYQSTLLVSHQLFLKQMDNDIKDFKEAERRAKNRKP